MNALSSTGPLLDPEWMAFLEPVSRLHATNPFEPAWEDLLKAALGRKYIPADTVAYAPNGTPRTSRIRLGEQLAWMLTLATLRLEEGVAGTPRELEVYQGAAIYGLWDQLSPRLQKLIDDDEIEVAFYDHFVERHRSLLGYPGLTAPEPAHLLALFYQAQRAWYFASSKIRGGSPSARAARAAVWRANMGVDISAYADGLHRRMDEIPVLITGETGTGKELAAECVGWSRYLPFDPATRRFAMKYAAGFHVRNLCEVPRELVESALFGHKRGSFTGADTDATGCFALPKQYGSLFLDEIGELPEHVQVKLLRPLQSREYVPVGETRPRKILGRHLFATHRDLDALCREGRFRPDLHERMNGVSIHMPPLRQMIAEAPEEMRYYVRWFVAAKIDDPERVEKWTERVVNAIAAKRIGDPWSRNLRELKNYTERYLLTDGRMSTPEERVRVSMPVAEEKRAPEGHGAPESACLPSSGILGPRAKAGEITVEELTRAYVTRVHVLTGQNRSETARRTGLNWRTVGQRLDPARLLRWLREAPKGK